MQLIKQLVLLIVTVLIGVMYIQPRIMELQLVQQEAAQFAEAVDKAAQFNSQLSFLLNQADSLTPDQERTLDLYLPVTMDTVAVARDIENIAVQNSLTVESIEADGSDALNSVAVSAQDASVGVDLEAIEESRDLRNKLKSQEVSVTLSGQYSSFKSFLEATESNFYPLRVTSMTIMPQEGEFAAPDALQYEIVFEVYSVNSNNLGN